MKLSANNSSSRMAFTAAAGLFAVAVASLAISFGHSNTTTASVGSSNESTTTTTVEPVPPSSALATAPSTEPAAPRTATEAPRTTATATTPPKPSGTGAETQCSRALYAVVVPLTPNPTDLSKRFIGANDNLCLSSADQILFLTNKVKAQLPNEPDVDSPLAVVALFDDEVTSCKAALSIKDRGQMWLRDSSSAKFHHSTDKLPGSPPGAPSVCDKYRDGYQGTQPNTAANSGGSIDSGPSCTTASTIDGCKDNNR